VNGYYDQIIEQLRKYGYSKLSGGKGSHEKWGKGSVILIVPFNCQSRHTANSIMKDAGIRHKF
jgi:predicted RNA binding protein YcfA (HicA-like mRNA interferase family)